MNYKITLEDDDYKVEVEVDKMLAVDAPEVLLVSFCKLMKKMIFEDEEIINAIDILVQTVDIDTEF